MLGGDASTSAECSAGRWRAASGSTRHQWPVSSTGRTGSRGAHSSAGPIGWPYSLVRAPLAGEITGS